MSFGEAIEQGVKAICRPPRSLYDPEDIPPTVPIPQYGEVIRMPIKFKNCRDQTIVGSLYQPYEGSINLNACVIYLHGNASCQLEGVFLIPIFVPYGISVLCIDTSGSGMSEGEYISLGLLEKDDVIGAIDFVKQEFGITKFVLWGRSMGAACVFFCLDEDEQRSKHSERSIVGAIADSPFSSLEKLIRELAVEFSVPGCLTTPAVWYVTRKIKSFANYDIHNVEPIKHAPNCSQPIIIIHAECDDFINVDHSKRLLEAYGGEKQLIIVHGDHNTERSNKVMSKAIGFLANCLGTQIDTSKLTSLIKSANHHFADVLSMVNEMSD